MRLITCSLLWSKIGISNFFLYSSCALGACYLRHGRWFASTIGILCALTPLFLNFHWLTKEYEDNQVKTELKLILSAALYFCLVPYNSPYEQVVPVIWAVHTMFSWQWSGSCAAAIESDSMGPSHLLNQPQDCKDCPNQAYQWHTGDKGQDTNHNRYAGFLLIPRWLCHWAR